MKNKEALEALKYYLAQHKDAKDRRKGFKVSEPEFHEWMMGFRQEHYVMENSENV